MQDDLYEVKGGWHAADRAAGLTAFGATPDDAKRGLEEARALQARLHALGQATKYGRTLESGGAV